MTMIQSDPAKFYLDGQYATLNPSWDIQDSSWKAGLVEDLMRRHSLQPKTVAEIGCGAGAVIASLGRDFPNADLFGWDIAPGLEPFWTSRPNVRFVRGDFLEQPEGPFDVLLLLDVIEHVANPHDFLSRLAPWGRNLILHIPLDLSVASVWLERPLLRQRRTVGHIHYYTRNLALELLNECGYNVVEVSFTGAHLRSRPSLSGKFASAVRRAIFALSREGGVRLLGGDTLIVLARPREVV